MTHRGQRGFTLIEVLLATVLLAAGLALAFVTLRSAIALSGRGEAIAERSERVRAVSSFLRRRLTGALPVALANDPQTLEQQRFIGEPQRMRFVAEVPDYLGRGGPYLHDLTVSGSGDRQQLSVALQQIQAGKIVTENGQRPPERLADDLRKVRLRYRGLDAQGKLGDWQTEWETSDRLPLQVSIEIEDARGDAWPALVVALPQGQRPWGR